MAVKVSVTICLIPEAKGGPFVLWDDLPAAVRLADELGFDAVELFPAEPDALDLKAVCALLANHNLSVSAVGSGAGWVRHKLSLTHADAAHRARARDFARSISGISLRSIARQHQAASTNGNGHAPKGEGGAYGPVARAVASSVKPQE